MANRRTAFQYLFEVNHVSFPWYLMCVTALYAADALSGGTLSRIGIIHDRLIGFLLFSGVLEVLYRIAWSGIDVRVLRIPQRWSGIDVRVLRIPIEQYRSLFSFFTLVLLALDITFLFAVPTIPSSDLLFVLTSRLNTLLFLAVAVHLADALTTPFPLST